jgi:hypothetical protein
MERMLVMQGIDGRHVHTLVPKFQWNQSDPLLAVVNNVPKRLVFPAGLTYYNILFRAGNGANQGEGCLSLAAEQLLPKYGDLEGMVYLDSANRTLRRKHIFGRYYAMCESGNLIKDTDFQNEVTGAYRVIFEEAKNAPLYGDRRDGSGNYPRYVHWQANGLPVPPNP